MIMKSTLGRKLIPYGPRKAQDIRCGHPPSFWARCQNAGPASRVILVNIYNWAGI